MPGEVKEDQEGIETMKNLGQNMAYLLKALGESHQRIYRFLQHKTASS